METDTSRNNISRSESAQYTAEHEDFRDCFMRRAHEATNAFPPHSYMTQCWGSHVDATKFPGCKELGPGAREEGAMRLALTAVPRRKRPHLKHVPPGGASSEGRRGQPPKVLLSETSRFKNRANPYKVFYDRVHADAGRERTRLPKASVLRQPAPSVAPGERALRVDLVLIKKLAAAWLDYPTC